jgi:hypothetical protein
MPPNRPFDLGTIPGAGVPIAAPRRPVRQASTVTFFADPHAPIGSGAHHGPFDRLDAAARESAQFKTN